MKVSSISIKERAYKALIRPLVEFASCGWDPYTEKNIAKVESVQRRAEKFYLGRYRNTSSVGEMLASWPSLQSR